MLLTEEILATDEDYELTDDDTRYQLIGGRLVVVPSPTPYHQGIAGNLHGALWAFLRTHDLGKAFIAPLDVRFNKYNVYQPDVLFVRKEKVRSIGRDKLRTIPDVVVEILSPSNDEDEMNIKKATYCESGVAEYWIIDPLAETVEIMVNEAGAYRTQSFLRKQDSIESAMLPGFRITLEELFSF